MTNTPELKDWQTKWRCRKCQDVIYSRYDGEFVTCKCGAISVDQTPYYARYIGNKEDFEALTQMERVVDNTDSSQFDSDRASPNETNI